LKRVGQVFVLEELGDGKVSNLLIVHIVFLMEMQGFVLLKTSQHKFFDFEPSNFIDGSPNSPEVNFVATNCRFLCQELFLGEAISKRLLSVNHFIDGSPNSPEVNFVATDVGQKVKVVSLPGAL
jgi:hypothetical protein